MSRVRRVLVTLQRKDVAISQIGTVPGDQHFSATYVIAEYNERTGSVNWQRIVLASQREQIDKWLEDHYPGA